MSMRFGPGPVFVYECLTASRKWQFYVSRVVFVLFLLIGLAIVLAIEVPHRQLQTFGDLAMVGQSFYRVLIAIQITLVLFLAPAAAAGSICVDKARGTLTHVFTTDLSNYEIVLGKLGSRLLPVLLLVGCALPVTLLATFLGGIDPDILLGAFLATLGVAVLGCSLALFISVWARKPHEVVMAVYMIWVIWLLAPWAFELSVSGSRAMLGSGPPPWIRYINVYWLVFAPYDHPGSVGLEHFVGFVGVLLVISAILVGVAIAKVRVVAIRQLDQVKKSRRGFSLGWVRRATRWVPSPSLDFNPVLWREWHHKKPTRWGRFVVIVYVACASLASLAAIAQALQARGAGFLYLTPIFNAFQVSIGLLLLSTVATTSLAEERSSGSLDVLLSTPLPTRSILIGKWWATFRLVPWLALWPCLVVAASTEAGSWGWASVAILGLVLAYGAAITSLGIAIATWVPRLGRALAVNTFLYLGITIGTLCLVAPFQGRMDTDQYPWMRWASGGAIVVGGVVLWRLLRRLGRTAAIPTAIAFAGIGAIWFVAISSSFDHRNSYASLEVLMCLSPWFGPGQISAQFTGLGGRESGDAWAKASFWTLEYGLAALVLFCLTLATFDRCLGRVRDKSSPKLFNAEEWKAMRAKADSARAAVLGRFSNQDPLAPSEAGVGELAQR